MEPLTLIATAFGLGLLFNAAPGPVFAATVQVGVRGGFKPALAVQLGSIVGDGVWAAIGSALAFLGLAFVSLRDLWQSARDTHCGALTEPSTFVLEDNDARAA